MARRGHLAAQAARVVARLPLGWRLALLLCLPLIVLNTTVALVGSTLVFPLSPFFLREKVLALRGYAVHRVACLWRGHPDLGPLVSEAERRHGLPPGLLGAVVHVESRSLPHRISGAGAMGPAQLMHGTARHLGVADPFDPGQALDGGARYLKLHLRRFQDLRLAVAAYNAGPGNVQGRVPHNGETEHYVARVMAEYQRRRPPPPPAPPPPPPAPVARPALVASRPAPPPGARVAACSPAPAPP